MVETEDSGGLFNCIVGDMKVMGPLWEDLIVKSSKFYASVKQTALTADAFLDTLQKIADVTTGSKEFPYRVPHYQGLLGSRNDFHIHSSIKTYKGIIPNLVSKISLHVILSATRDIGMSFTKIVMRHRAIENKLKTYVGILADSLLTPMQECVDEWKKNSSQLEKDHTKDYKRVKSDLKRVNAEAAKLKKKASKKAGKQEYTEQYREAMKVANQICRSLEEQEKSYLRKLMLEERSRVAYFFKCYKPCMEQELTLISEVEQLQSIVEETSKLCENTQQLPVLYEETVIAYKVPDYLQPGGKNDHSPPSSPMLVKDRSLSASTACNNQKTPSMTRCHTVSCTQLDPMPVCAPTWTDTLSSRSSYSSSGSLGTPTPIYDPVNLHEVEKHNSNERFVQPNQAVVNKIRHSNTNSWSSIGTSDSSGIGSYNSLTSQNKMAARRSGSESDVIEMDYDENEVYDANSRYATIDRSHFKRHQMQTSSLRAAPPSIPRSNSLEEDPIPDFPDYKMNLPKSKNNTVARFNFQVVGRQNIFNAFSGQTPAELLKRLSPTSPVKVTNGRRNSSPAPPPIMQKPVYRMRRQNSDNTVPSLSTVDNEPEVARPGSFEAALQARRKTIRNKSVDYSTLQR